MPLPQLISPDQICPNEGTGDWKQICKILDDEIDIALRLHEVMLRDSRIEFEASNHYYYTVNDLKEKILNCENLKLAEPFCTN